MSVVMLAVLCVVWAALASTALASSAPANGQAVAPSCPPLNSKTVQATCVFQGRPYNCAELPSPPGTEAVFRCRPLHELLFGYVPAAGFGSRCGRGGEWSVQPFRCVPVCGRPTGKATALVRNGERVSSAADFPWHVTVFNVTAGTILFQICGGSLVTTKFFVSAAHCFHNNHDRQQPPELYRAGFARTRRDATIDEPNQQFRNVRD